MENQLVFIIWSTLLSAMCSLNEAAPVHHIHQRQVETADGPDDVRWRLMSGIETLWSYAEKLTDQILACDSEPLITAGEHLQSILNGICELMAVQELTGKVYNESDLHKILQQNILDSCHWLNDLVNRGEVSASERFLALNDTCDIGDMPRLNQYCLETKLASDSFYTNIYVPASNYYAGIVVDQDIPTWLNASLAPETNEEVMTTFSWTPPQNITCIF